MMDVRNPATELVIAEVPVADEAAVNAAVATAKAAFGPWSQTDVEQRRQRLRDCGARLAAQVDAISATLTAEQGKPLAQARGEVQLAAAWFGHVADLDLGEQTLVDSADTLMTLHRNPFGVVAAITPFNFPIILAVCKIAPALLAGNTVVVKPAPDTPLSTVAMVRALQQDLPDGVLDVVTGDGATGRALVGHPDVAKISFTGSVEAGRAIAAQAGAALKSVTLELGGNDPALLLPGVDVPAIAHDLFWSAFVNSGQFCSAIKRVYVHRTQYAEVMDALAAIADTVRVGDGSDPATELGPVTNEAQLRRVAGLVEAARSDGARVCTGGRRADRRGYFYLPTIVADLPIGTGLEIEEQFGPALPVIAYDDPSTVVDRVNATAFGLGASVWGDPELAAQLAPRIVAGSVWTNKHADLRPDAPFGGVRCSGIGVEYGFWGLLEYSQIKILNARR